MEQERIKIKQNKLGSDIKTMGIALAENDYDTLKEYARLTLTSMSKCVVDSVNFSLMKQVVDLANIGGVSRIGN
jgi:hypothetical protein